MPQQPVATMDASRETDRKILLMSVAFWFAFMISMISKSYFSGQFDDFGYMLSRAIIAVSGLGLVRGLQLILKYCPVNGPLKRFWYAAGLSIFASFLLTAISEFAFAQFSPGNSHARLAMFLVRADWIETFAYYYWIFVAWSALYSTTMNAADLRERDRRLAAAERTAQQAQLAALRLQIHPHFLFNVLNALSGLVALGRQGEAERMIQDLSSFLRRTLTADPDQMTPLRDEIEVQMMYLGIEQMRYSDRLRIVCSVPEECKDALVPNLILQPLVENAIKHALAPTDGVVCVTMGAARRDAALDIWIKDEGAAVHDPTPGFGIGLKNVRDRLRALFGDGAKLTAGPEGTGWTSSISIPWTKTKPCAS